MRITPRVGKKLWFGPRDGGWGWQPETREGWVAVWLVMLVVVAGAGVTMARPDLTFPLFGAAIALLFGIGFAKGSTPGGTAARREFERLRDEDPSKRLDIRRMK